MRVVPGLFDSFAILDHLPIAVMVLDAASKDVLLLNRKFTQLFGYTEDILRNERQWWPLAFPESGYRDHILREWDRRVHLAKGDGCEMEPLEAQATCADGRECTIRKHLACHGNLDIVTFVDISDQKLMQRQYEQLATTDSLTGLANRRAFFAGLEKCLSLAMRYKRPMSVMLADIDHFKTVNDTHGHQAGDAVLTHFSTILTRTLRTSDLAARIGGEEFALLLPETDSAGAYRMAERLRVVVVEDICLWGATPIPITVSFGLACLAEPGGRKRTTCDDFLRFADNALYSAKREGRNRVSVQEIRLP